MNALKHGLLARSLIVRGQQYQESENDFKKVCAAFYAAYQPVGAAEEMLVEQIVQANWRLRRARTAEAGEIALNVDGGHWRRQRANPLLKIMSWPDSPFSEAVATRLEASATGCHYLAHSLREVLRAVEQAGELTEVALTELQQSLWNHRDGSFHQLKEMRDWLVANPEQLASEILRVRHKDMVVSFLSKKLERLFSLEEERSERERVEEQSRQAAAVLPAPEPMDKILRYETALQRELYRAMNQLERMQRQRQGEVLPAPLTVEVSGKA